MIIISEDLRRLNNPSL